MPSADAIVVRPARKRDLPALARLGAALARAHHEWDPDRFFVVDGMEDGYAWWLGKELANRDAVVLAAEQDGRIVGYAYGRIEPRDWNALRDRCGVGVDLMVDPAARGRGAGRRLVEELVRRLAENGAPRVVIHTAQRNTYSRRVFARLGFRRTMVEMTREVGPSASRSSSADAPRSSRRGRR